jgi:large subunit ribosomal protein L4
MASAPSYKADGSAGPKVELNAAVFDVEPNEGLVHQIAVSMMENKRHGNHETKTRAQVRGGGKKPYAQKGTGNARHGSSREPQMRGGGTVWGPHKRSHRQGVPVRMKRKALCCVLTDRLRNDALCVIDGIGDTATPKTKPVADLVAQLNPEGRKALIVSGENNAALVASARNLTRVNVTTAADLNVLDVLGARRVIVLKDALARLEERLA